MIIGVTNIKGGVGKTTSSLAIATAAQKDRTERDGRGHRPARQRHIVGTGRRGRGLTRPPPSPSCRRTRPRYGACANAARTATANGSVIDTPPNGSVVDEAIKTADFVVIPTLSSPIDLQQTMLTAAQCQDAGKDYAVLIVMARKDTNAWRVSGPPRGKTVPASSIRRSCCARTSRPISATHSEATSTDTRTCGTN